MTFRRSTLAVAACLGTAHALAAPAFYVVDLRHTGDAILHASSRSPLPRAGLRYVVLDKPDAQCCFLAGPRPGQRKSLLKIDEDAPPLISEEGDESYQSIGHATGAQAAGGDNLLAFGVEGMSTVAARGRRTYELRAGKDTVVVRNCMGQEGVNFQLYRRLRDKRPYATYYFALGYPVRPDCP